MKQKSQILDDTEEYLSRKELSGSILICICIEKHEGLCQLWVYMDM